MRQLVYGSADQIAGRDVGGWGVLHTTGGIGKEEGEALLKLTSVAMPSTLPQFPSAQQLQQRAVRFRIGPLGDGFAACRSVEAGTDHTGRPGNVVSHCAVIDARPTLRPVDWFFSPGWVTPYGSRQVAEAVPPAELPAPRGWEDTAAWLRADPSRTARIRWVVDLALTQLLGQERLVMVGPSAAECAHWISMLSWVLDPGTINLVRICIGEDPRSAIEQLATVPVVVAVTAPLDPKTLRGVPQLDLGWHVEQDPTGDGARWRLPDGSVAGRSNAAALVVDLAYAEPEVALAVFAKRDEFIARYLDAGNDFQPGDYLAFLQAAWLTTPGAQVLARSEPIRYLLDSVSDEILRWDEFVALATEVGVPVPTDSPAEDINVYAMAPEVVDPWQVDDEPNGLEAALIGAAALGKAGVDVERLLAVGRLAERIDEQPEELRQAMRDIVAALEPHATIHGEDL